jgi:hypothetical protein
LTYRQYLATVRAQKAKSQSVSPAFERNVQAQARQALADVQDFSAAALRITQQASQTSFWSQVLNTASATLKSTGPVTVQQLWNEINQNLQDPQNAAQLAAAGLTNEMAAAITSGIQNVNANLLAAICLGVVAIEAGGIPALGAVGGQLLAEFSLFAFAALVVDFVEHLPSFQPVQQSSP